MVVSQLPSTAEGAALRKRYAMRFAAISCLLCCVLAILAILWPRAGIDYVAIFFLFAYILAEPRNVRLSQQLLAIALAIAGMALAFSKGAALDVFWEGSRGTLMFLLLFASVMLLQYPALHSPSMAVVRQVVTHLPPGRRYLWLSLASHFLSAITNFAGFALLSSFVMTNAQGELQKRMALALSRGFVVASCWSPFFLAMAVVVSLMPTLRWLDIALPGIILALLLIAFGSLCDWWSARGATNDSGAAPQVAGKQAAFARLGALSLALVGGVAAFNDLTGISMSATIAIVVTIFSLAWLAIILRGKSKPEQAIGFDRYASSLVDNVGSLRGIAVLFVGANIFGQGIARVIDGQLLVHAAASVGIAGVLWIPFILVIIATSSALGLHSVVLIVVLGHTLPLDSIGISQASLALVFLASWGIGGVLSPLSNLTLYTAQMLGRSNWVMAWRDNGPYSLGCIVIASLLIMTFHWLTWSAA